MHEEIVVVRENFSQGGQERVLSLLMNEWVDMGHKVSLLLLRENDYKERFSISEKIEVIESGKDSKNLSVRIFKDAFKVLSIVKKRKSAKLIAFGHHSVLVVGMCKPFVKNKMVFSERCDPYSTPSNVIRANIRNKLFEYADVCVFQTEDAKKYFSLKTQKKGFVIPNPINPNLPNKYEGVRRKTVVASCQLIGQKNVPMMIDAFKEFSIEYPEYTLEIYGRGPLEKDLKEYVKEKGMAEKILFKGFSSTVFEKMVDCSMYISSSNYEGISNSMLEALGMGVPTIVTDCPIGGARMTIKDGYNGLLVSINDAHGMCMAMKRIAGDKEFADMLSEHSLEINNKYKARNIAQMWIDAIS